MAPTTNDSKGRIEVSPQVVAAIAEEAVLQCYGIVGLASRRQGGVWTSSPGGKRYRKGVVVHTEGGQMVLDLYVIIEYGTRICEVARNVMSSVKFAVEQALGIPVRQVNVNVQGIHLGNPQA
jgi:uncharacterized alkaline shock family protein YloU